MIWFILVLGLIIRLVSLNQSLWLDEAINTLAVQHYGLFDLITTYAKADFHPPGWIILLWFWGKMFGYSEIAVRIPSVIFSILNIWVVYLLGKKLFSKKMGLLAALLICLNPLHIYYSQEARMYMMASLAVTINMFVLIKLIKGEKMNLLYLVLSNIFVLSSDYLAYFIFPAQLIFLFFYKKNVIKKWLLALGLGAVSGFWWIPIFLSQFNVGSVASANLPTWKLVVGSFDYKTIPLTLIKFIIGRISISDKFLYAGILLPICILFIYLIFLAVKSIADSVGKIIIYWILIPPILATLISFFVPIYNYFRVLFVLPGFIILISTGILSLRKKIKIIVLVTVIFIEAFSSLVYLFDPAFHRENWKGFVESFQSKKNEGIILFESSGILPPFDYYSRGKLNGMGALKDFPAKNENDVVDLEPSIKNSKDVYLVDYLVEISDPKRLVSKRLIKMGFYQTDILNFNGVGFIYHYVK